MRRLVLLLLTVLATVTATAVSAAMLTGVAAAAGRNCHQEAVKNPDGTITYHLVCDTTHPGEPGTPGGGAEEDCGQDEVTPGPGDGPYFCSGGIPCAYTTNVVPLALPTTDPEPGKQWQVLICDHGGTFTKEWVQTGGTQPRPLIVQAQEAYGNLAPPGAAVRHSPEARGIVGRLLDGLLPGSYLVQCDGTTTDASYVKALAEYRETIGVPYIPRAHEQIAAYFEGLELLEPGVVPIHQWRPEPGLVGVPAAVDESGGVGRKPLTPG